MDIQCVGGGPAGLYFAICAKLRNPRHRIRVLERGREGETYGWSFGFWDQFLTDFYANDPVIGKQVEAECGVWDGIEVYVGDGPPAYLGGYGLSMSRHRLLEILVSRARELDIELCFEHEVTDLGELAGADLVVASDGINSRVRGNDPAAFGTTVEVGQNYYLWLGTDKVFRTFEYGFVRTEAGWIWLHSYYLDEQRSTCMVECPPQTWHGLGLDELGPRECLKTLEKIFASRLDGHSLISQVSDVDTFIAERGRQVRNARWYRDNIALIGDAAHTTHFSVGAGTRLAVGDALALAEMIDVHGDDVAAALRAYDATRRPVIDGAQGQALNSMRFLEGAPALLDDPDTDPAKFAYLVSTRLGNRGQRWRYYMHLATQLRVPREMRRKITTARRMRRVRQRAKSNELVAPPSSVNTQPTGAMSKTGSPRG